MIICPPLIPRSKALGRLLLTILIGLTRPLNFQASLQLPVDGPSLSLLARTKQGFAEMWQMTKNMFSGAYTQLIETDLPGVRTTASETKAEVLRFGQQLAAKMSSGDSHPPLQQRPSQPRQTHDESERLLP